MRIGIISYEGSADFGGGIGTYVKNVSEMMANRGHVVEIFTSQLTNSDAPHHERVSFHCVTATRADFPKLILQRFVARHEFEAFDVIESAEMGADADAIVATYPGLPLVVKLHTPTFCIDELNNAYLPWWRKARFIIGSLRRGHFVKPYWIYDPARDRERIHAQRAKEITAPSRAILEMLSRRWQISRERVHHVPNPFLPAPELLAVPIETLTRRITFIGRLEARKGILVLVRAMRHILARVPDVGFRLVGQSLPHPVTGEDMEAHIRRALGANISRVEFTGRVPYSQIPAYLRDTDICVFPSIWEASGFVCKEAMAAARGVIATNGSGMAEIVRDGVTGRLTPPGDVNSLTSAISDMLNDPRCRMAMGSAARQHIVEAYAPDVIAPLQEESYRRAIGAL